MRVPAPVLSQCPIPRGQGTHRLETRSASAGGSGCISLPVGARRGTSRQSPRSRPRRAWCEEAAEPWAWLTSPPGAAAGGWVLGRGGPLTGAGRAGTTFNPLLLPGPLQPCQPRPFPQPYLLPCSFPELTGLAWGCLVWPERHWGAQQGFMKDVSFPPPEAHLGPAHVSPRLQPGVSRAPRPALSSCSLSCPPLSAWGSCSGAGSPSPQPSLHLFRAHPGWPSCLCASSLWPPVSIPVGSSCSGSFRRQHWQFPPVLDGPLCAHVA